MRKWAHTSHQRRISQALTPNSVQNKSVEINTEKIKYHYLSQLTDVLSEDLKEEISIIDMIDSINKENENSVMDEVSNFISKKRKNIEKNSLVNFLYPIIYHSCKIRIKHAKNLANLISFLCKKFDIQPPFLIGPDRYISSVIKSVLSDDNSNSDISDLTYFYPAGSLEQIIESDDISEFQRICSTPVFDINAKITPVRELPYVDFSHKEMTPMQLCSLFASVKCFKFCLLNDAEVKEEFCNEAIAGGETEIIHVLEHNDLKFTGCFEVAMVYHRTCLCDWLLEHYVCNAPTLVICIANFNEIVLAFLLLNGYKGSNEDSGCTSLHHACEKGSVEIVKLLVENGFDVNAKDPYNYTPLKWARTKNFNEIENFLLNHGAIQDEIVSNKEKKAQTKVGGGVGGIGHSLVSHLFNK